MGNGGRSDLRRRVAEASRRALDRGGLVPLGTRLEVVEDQGVAFAVRVLANLEHKAAARALQQEAGSNPFLPYDPEMLVSELSTTHLCLLNKYNVFEGHVLIVTREFESQQSWLGRSDLQALAQCLAGIDGLGFYNAGAVAGASQEHKHLQLVPLPLGRGPEPIPIASVLSRVPEVGTVARVPGLGFENAFWRFRETFTDAASLGERLLAGYCELRAALGIEQGRTPYNLLATRSWLLMVPRIREHFETISVNALGFAGSLLVRTGAELELVRRHGPMAVLAAVAGPVGT